MVHHTVRSVAYHAMAGCDSQASQPAGNRLPELVSGFGWGKAHVFCAGVDGGPPDWGTVTIDSLHWMHSAVWGLNAPTARRSTWHIPAACQLMSVRPRLRAPRGAT